MPAERYNSEGGVIARKVSDSEAHQGKELAYTPEAKAFISEHPGIVADVTSMVEAIGDGSTAQELAKDDVKVSLEGQRDHSRFYLVEAFEEKFFLKADERVYKGAEGGFNELVHSGEAKELLKDMEGVEVVEYQLGYRDKKRNYFFSKWNDVLASGESLEDYVDALSDEVFFDEPGAAAAQEELSQLNARSALIRSRLAHYYDFDEQNMVYDKKNKKIIVFDLNVKK